MSKKAQLGIFLIASTHQLSNLNIIIDYNKIQALSKIKDVLPLDSLSAKFNSFNCKCVVKMDSLKI